MSALNWGTAYFRRTVYDTKAGRRNQTTDEGRNTKYVLFFYLLFTQNSRKKTWKVLTKITVGDKLNLWLALDETEC